MIALYTDFGLADPYVGQLHAVLAVQAPDTPVIDLFHAVPDFDIRAGAYLLPAYAMPMPAGTVFVCVVDPGVGGERRPLVLQADDHWYVGPDNGLFEIVARRAVRSRCWLIQWRPERLSTSFHGRDLFAPVAAQLARGQMPPCEETVLTPPPGPRWPDDFSQIIYIDHYGNLVTGLRAERVSTDTVMLLGQHRLTYAPVFAAVAAGQAFWYENANGLVEVAINQGRAVDVLGVRLGAGLALA